MSLSDVISQNKTALGIIALAIIVIVGMQLLGGKGESATSGGLWYYDLDTAELVPHTASEPSPVTLPSGHAAVLAHVFGCDGCGGNTFLGYLERLDPAAKAQRVAQVDAGPMDLRRGQQVAVDPKFTGGKLDWVGVDSPDASAVMAASNQCESGQRVKECLPGK